LEALSWRGFGRKASTGLGAFEVDGDPEPCTWLDIKDSHNGFVSLSHFVPRQSDPTDGLWRLHLKHPKFASDRVPTSSRAISSPSPRLPFPDPGEAGAPGTAACSP